MTLSKLSSNSPKAPSDLIYKSGDDLRVPPEQRVYVNRNLRLESIQAIGFDLDHTLAHYDQLAVGELAFAATRRKLTEKKGYPDPILGIRYDPDSFIRGLIIDLERGNILKMDLHNYVHRASHGLRPMSSSERRNLYSSARFDFSSDGIASVDTLFHIPEAHLYASLVDFFERRGQRIDYKRLFHDVRAMMDEAHRDGSIKREITAHPDRYIRLDPLIFDLFAALISSGKKLFIATNSEPEYTEALMGYMARLLNPPEPWKNYFTLVVSRAGKPTFFSRRRSGSQRAEKRGGEHCRCRNAFELEKQLGCRSDQIMYFGDHTYGDILTAKKRMGWRTGMIVPELEAEISAALKIRRAYNQLVKLSAQRKAAEKEKEALDRELLARAGGVHASPSPVERAESLDELLQGLSEEIDNLESICQYSFNANWGSIFREGKLISRFGHQVRDFACLYMHRVSNLINYPMDHYFQADLDFMPHEYFL